MKGYVGETALEVFTEGTPKEAAHADALDVVLAAAGRAPAASSSRSRPADRPSDPMDPGRIERLVKQMATTVAGGMVEELGDALRAEIALELARAKPPPKATGDAGTATVPVRVQNDRTEKVHLVAVGADSGLPAKRWKSFCGWEVGRWGGYAFVGGASQAPTCDRCLDYWPT